MTRKSCPLPYWSGAQQNASVDSGSLLPLLCCVCYLPPVLALSDTGACKLRSRSSDKGYTQSWGKKNIVPKATVCERLAQLPPARGVPAALGAPALTLLLLSNAVTPHSFSCSEDASSPSQLAAKRKREETQELFTKKARDETCHELQTPFLQAGCERSPARAKSSTA